MRTPRRYIQQIEGAVREHRTLNDVCVRQEALARWENEGGATTFGKKSSVLKTLPAHVVTYKKTAVILRYSA